MKITYEILWFEDQPSALEHDLTSIGMYLEASGYTISVDMKTVINDNEIDQIASKISKYNKYDMIVCDFDMGRSPDGSIIAKKLRAEVFTDMVFYSGKAPDELRKILFENRVDGVFVVDRAKLADEFELILEDHIKKACDVNGIRGVVMDETSRFDRMLRNKCAKLLANCGTGELESVRGDIVRRITTSAENRIRKARDIKCPITALNDFQTSDFNLVRHRLDSLMKKAGHVTDLLSDTGELKKVQDLRNRLAHLESIYSEEGWMSLSDDREEKFNFERFREIRKTLREIGLALEKI